MCCTLLLAFVYVAHVSVPIMLFYATDAVYVNRVLHLSVIKDCRLLVFACTSQYYSPTIQTHYIMRGMCSLGIKPVTKIADSSALTN